MKHQWVSDDIAFGMADLSYCKVCNVVHNHTNLNDECAGGACQECISPMDCIRGCAGLLPVEKQPLVYRLRYRAMIRRQAKDRKSVQEGSNDRISDLLEEAANFIDSQR